ARAVTAAGAGSAGAGPAPRAFACGDLRGAGRAAPARGAGRRHGPGPVCTPGPAGAGGGSRAGARNRGGIALARAGVELPTVAFRVASVTEVDADAVVVNL